MDIKASYEAILDRWEELNIALAQPDAMADRARYLALTREYNALEAQVNAWRACERTKQALREALELQQDPDWAEEAAREAGELRASLSAQEEELRRMLFPPDPVEGRNVVLEIRAGAGGEEAALFGGDLLRMYGRYAANHGCRLEVLSLSESDLNGVKEAVCLIRGQQAWHCFKYESGVHRVQRVPVTDTTGKKQTSTCTVAVLPEAEEVECVIDPAELRIDTFRASGAGGQYVNRTDSAIRITHLPPGLVVTCQDAKSQLMNREKAMRVLRSRLLSMKRSEAEASYAEKRRVQVGTGDRSERIRTYNFHEGRVTDHRIGLTVYHIEAVMDGGLDEIVAALHLAEDRLKEEPRP